MKYFFVYLIIIAALIRSDQVVAQYSFKSQVKYKPFGQALIDTAHISTCPFDKEILEIRFWKVTYTNTAHQLFIFRLLTNNQWQLKKYSFCSWDWKRFSAIKIDSVALSNNWNAKWDSLRNNHFLTLPSQSEVQKKWRASDGTMTVIADGHKYVVELITKKRKRQYSYVNPESFLQYYDLGNRELILMNNNLKFLDEELGFSSFTKECF